MLRLKLTSRLWESHCVFQTFRSDQLSHRPNRRRIRQQIQHDSFINNFSFFSTNVPVHDVEDVDEDDVGVFQVSGVCQQCVEV